MFREIQQVLRLIMLLGKHREDRGLKPPGGLLVLLWTDNGASLPSLCCTIAAAGRWCAGIEMEALRPVLRDLKELMFPCSRPCSHTDQEELRAFALLHGPVQILLSFQMKDEKALSTAGCAQIEAFLHTFSLANAAIRIHLKFKFSHQQTYQRKYRAKITRKAVLADQPSPLLDVTSSKLPPEGVRRGSWCYAGHPVVGGRVPLSIPPEAMNQGLFGELSVQTVTVLRPCLLQYPNLTTQLTHIQLLLFGPSNVPISGPSSFLQNLSAHLDCADLGLQGIKCSPSEELVYTLDQEPCKDPEPVQQQSLLVFLFLQHSDPFSQHITDTMGTEELIERHLEDILNNNRRAFTTCLQKELKKELTAQEKRKKDTEKVRSAAELILSSSLSIVSSSSNMGFRNACLDNMKVTDTHGLSASLRESLMRVTTWKFVARSTCHQAEMEEHPATNEPTRAEV